MEEHIKLLLKPIIENLKLNQAAIYGDHPNLWIDLGWDICQGDGSITRHAEDLIVNHIECLPNIVQQFIWWESIGGKVAKKQILSMIEKNQDELTTFEEVEHDEFIEDIVDYLKTALFNLAEADYERFEGDECTDDEIDNDN